MKPELLAELETRERAQLVYNAKTMELIDETCNWRKENPGRGIGECGLSSIWIGNKTLSYHKFELDLIEKLGLTELHNKMKENAFKAYQEKYKRLLPIAEAKLDEAEAMLNSLPNGVGINYKMEGDTHGIYEDYQYLYVEIEGITFERRI